MDQIGQGAVLGSAAKNQEDNVSVRYGHPLPEDTTGLSKAFQVPPKQHVGSNNF